MNALVTGATGFLGSNLVHALLKKGYSVRALVRSSGRRSLLDGCRVEFAEGDLSDASSLTAAVQGQDVVFHTAAMVTEWGRREDFFKINVAGTRSLLDASLQAGVQRFIHTSSLSVLGIPRDERPIDESRPYASDGLNPYTETKIEAERIVMNYCSDRGLPAVIVRPGIIWGPGDTTFLPRLLRLARYGVVCTIGRGDNRMCLSYIANIVGALLLAAEKREAVGQVYNITDDECITSGQYIAGLAKATGHRPPSFSLPYPLLYAVSCGCEIAAKLFRLSGAPLISRFGLYLLSSGGTYSMQKARDELGYQPAVSFVQGMQSISRWFSETGGVPEKALKYNQV